MTAVVTVVAALVPAILAFIALDRWRRARRTRRQLVDALAAVPELAGVTSAAAVEQTATLAAAVARRLGLHKAEVARVADAARLRPLVEVVASVPDAPWEAVRSVAAVTTESAIPAGTRGLLDEVLTAPRGRAGRGAAIVRVAETYVRELARTSDTPSGALFVTVAAHQTGYERRAAEALVHLVQGDPPSA